MGYRLEQVPIVVVHRPRRVGGGFDDQRKEDRFVGLFGSEFAFVVEQLHPCDDRGLPALPAGDGAQVGGPRGGGVDEANRNAVGHLGHGGRFVVGQVTQTDGHGCDRSGRRCLSRRLSRCCGLGIRGSVSG
jgi:hypothetical protein